MPPPADSARPAPPSARLAAHIQSLIQKSGGSIPFQEFMGAALYHPDWGYYAHAEAQVGQSGDFCTSVSVGPLFGELLALEFIDAFNHALRQAQPSSSPPLWLVESGAHDGQLAHDLLSALHRHAPQWAPEVHLLIVEPSPRRAESQQSKLAPFSPRCHWVPNWKAVSELLAPPPNVPPLFAIFYSNEFLDAFPIQRFGWDQSAQRWFEWHVALESSLPVPEFSWFRGPPPPIALLPDFLANIPAQLGAVLPDQFTVDTSRDAIHAWTQAAHSIPRGRLYAVDYGVSQSIELLQPQRARGTLRGYRQHRVSSNELAAPGSQDLTCHVDFQAVREAGEVAGWQTVALETQSRFLTRIAQNHAQNPGGLQTWTPQKARQFQSLVSPAFFGRNFWVLVQERKQVDDRKQSRPSASRHPEKPDGDI